MQLALDQVHQQEGEIVEHVAGGDRRIELDGVEQHRLAVDAGRYCRDADRRGSGARSRRAARAASSGRSRVSAACAAPCVSAATRVRREQCGHARSSASFCAMTSASSRGKIEVLHDGRRRMRLRHRAPQRVGERRVDLAARRADDRASASRRSAPSPPPIRPARRAADGEAAGLARDRHHAAVNRGAKGRLTSSSASQAALRFASVE